jgi:hypothetical protein
VLSSRRCEFGESGKVDEMVSRNCGQELRNEIFTWFTTVYQSFFSLVPCPPSESSWRRVNLAVSGPGRRMNDDCMTGSLSDRGGSSWRARESGAAVGN